jgi:uncharacterized membrane protein
MSFLKMILIATVLFFAIDMLWLGVVAKKFYKKELKEVMAPKVNWVAAMLFYFIFIVGLTFFVIEPAIRNTDVLYAMFAGAFFGLVCYATYDLTNLATSKNWSVKLTVVDLIWGSTLSFLVSMLTYFVYFI